jgi:hypothetical protein
MLSFSAFRQQFTTSTWLSSWCRGLLERGDACVA